MSWRLRAGIAGSVLFLLLAGGTFWVLTLPLSVGMRDEREGMNPDPTIRTPNELTTEAQRTQRRLSVGPNTEHRTPAAPRTKGFDRLWLGPNFAPRAQGMIRSLRLSAPEQAAVDRAIRQKVLARETLTRLSTQLYRSALEESTAESQLSLRVDEYGRARQAFQQRVREIDAELERQVSTRTRARLYATGVLDNGLGFMAGQPLQAAGPR